LLDGIQKQQQPHKLAFRACIHWVTTVILLEPAQHYLRWVEKPLFRCFSHPSCCFQAKRIYDAIWLL